MGRTSTNNNNNMPNTHHKLLVGVVANFQHNVNVENVENLMAKWRGERVPSATFLYTKIPEAVGKIKARFTIVLHSCSAYVLCVCICVCLMCGRSERKKLSWTLPSDEWLGHRPAITAAADLFQFTCLGFEIKFEPSLDVCFICFCCHSD